MIFFPSHVLCVLEVFLELNEKRNLNCLALKGMSGSAEWKVVLLMCLTSLSHCVLLKGLENTGMLWVGWLSWAGLNLWGGRGEKGHS